ncbi:hypothetical protein [Shouchella lehensis]|uniref:Nucleotidyltransferase domain-containing protein n=1 Tax=Shouchella lehensis G1 TaxID=1246626 RepID=A0A060LYW7_9BACI|nr:hypothetical protein [Shouchella lehensis]AIC92994.1 nucleotidyltransferase domain-containing protein [Shouchella lehensis G1]
MNQHQSEVLVKLVNAFQSKEVSFGIGGSTLLFHHAIAKEVNDLDFFIDLVDVKRAQDVLIQLGDEEQADYKKPFQTEVYKCFNIAGVSLDIMGGFAIEHEEGVYRFAFDSSAVAFDKGHIPYMLLEDWYVFYLLMPNRAQKVSMIEAHFRAKGIEQVDRLRHALMQPLPLGVKQRIIEWL